VTFLKETISAGRRPSLLSPQNFSLHPMLVGIWGRNSAWKSCLRSWLCLLFETARLVTGVGVDFSRIDTFCYSKQFVCWWYRKAGVGRWPNKTVYHREEMRLRVWTAATVMH